MNSMDEEIFTINFVKENVVLLKKYIDETVSEEEKPYIMSLIETHLETSLLENLVRINGIQSREIISEHDGNKTIEAQLISENVTITFEYTEDSWGLCVSSLLPVSIEITSSSVIAKIYKRLNELREIFSANIYEARELDPSLVAEYNSLINVLSENEA